MLVQEGMSIGRKCLEAKLLFLENDLQGWKRKKWVIVPLIRATWRD